MVPDMDWTDNAACKGKPLRWFFPEKGANAKRAKALCRTCPVIEQCRWSNDVIESSSTDASKVHGIYGGEAPRERARRRAAARLETAEAAA